MFKNRFLNTTAFFMAPDDEGKSAADKVRESIQVTNPNEETKDEQSSDDTGDNEETGEGEEETETEEAEPEVEETAEEKTAREADEAANAENKTARQIQRMQKRIDALTAKSRTTETEKAELLKLLEAKKEDGDLVLTEDEVERRAELKAEQKVAEREFDRAQKKLITAATKVDPKFMANVKTMTDEIGLLPPIMIGILEDYDNCGEVLDYLTKNVDEYEDIFQLSDIKMARALDKIAEKVKPKGKPVSKVPAPNTPIGAGKRGSPPLNDQMSDDEWIRKRSAERKAVGKM